jgi:hypothetical protein
VKYDPKIYSFSSFDEDMCLKPPLMLWLALLYLCRGFVMPIAIGIGHYAGVDSDAMPVLRDLWSANTLAPAAVAAPLFYALLRRAPAASPSVRWIWEHGRSFLIAAIALDLALAISRAITYIAVSSELLPAIVAATADMYFFAYVLFARRLRHSLSDFPPPRETAATRSGR